MHFLKMIRKLRDSCEPRTYAYATQVHHGWLMRMHVVRNGDPVLEYTLAQSTCEEPEKKWDWNKIEDPTGDDMDSDWLLKIPKEWIKPREFRVSEDDNNSCMNCAYRYKGPVYFCNKYRKFISARTICKDYRELPMAVKKPTEPCKCPDCGNTENLEFDSAIYDHDEGACMQYYCPKCGAEAREIFSTTYKRSEVYGHLKADPTKETYEKANTQS